MPGKRFILGVFVDRLWITYLNLLGCFVYLHG